MKRRAFLKLAPAAAAAALGLSTTVAAETITDGKSPLVDDARQFFGFQWSIPDEAVFRHGNPSWIVHYDEGKADSLEEWTEDTDRVLVHDSEHTDASLIAVEPGDIDDLLAFEWVESIDLDLRVELVEPVTPEESDAVDLTRELSIWQSLRADTDVLETGVAFEDDMPDASINDVRAYTNAEDEDAPNRVAVVLDSGVTAGSEFEDSIGVTRILDASKTYVDDRETVGEASLNVVEDENGHGNWVAAAMAGDGDDHTGYAPSADILALKVLDSDGSGSGYWIAEALRYAADEIEDGGVACLSLGSPLYSHELEQAISYAAGAGLPCVVAAGNDRMGTRTVAAPANAVDAITVTASTAEPSEDAKSAYFSNVDPVPGTTDASGGHTAGEHVDVIAPGCEIAVDTPDGESRLTGTSMATPCVAAGLLLLQSADSSVIGDVDAHRDRLRDYAAPMPAAGVTEAGAGYLDVAAMLEESDPGDDQEDARDDDAEARDAAHEALSNAEGGFLTGLL